MQTNNQASSNDCETCGFFFDVINSLTIGPASSVHVLCILFLETLWSLKITALNNILSSWSKFCSFYCQLWQDRDKQSFVEVSIFSVNFAICWTVFLTMNVSVCSVCACVCIQRCMIWTHWNTPSSRCSGYPVCMTGLLIFCVFQGLLLVSFVCDTENTIVLNCTFLVFQCHTCGYGPEIVFVFEWNCVWTRTSHDWPNLVAVQWEIRKSGSWKYWVILWSEQYSSKGLVAGCWSNKDWQNVAVLGFVHNPPGCQPGECVTWQINSCPHRSFCERVHPKQRHRKGWKANN